MIRLDKSAFKKYVINCEFEKAEILVQSTPIEEIGSLLVDIAYDTGSIAPYGFVSYLINKKEKAEYHCQATIILSFGINHLPNSYNLALYHLKKAIEIDDKNVGYKELFLLFNRIPEHLVSDKEAIDIAKDLLKNDPKNSHALEIISKYENKKTKPK